MSYLLCVTRPDLLAYFSLLSLAVVLLQVALPLGLPNPNPDPDPNPDPYPNPGQALDEEPDERPHLKRSGGQGSAREAARLGAELALAQFRPEGRRTPSPKYETYI